MVATVASAQSAADAPPTQQAKSKTPVLKKTKLKPAHEKLFAADKNGPKATMARPQASSLPADAQAKVAQPHHGFFLTGSASPKRLKNHPVPVVRGQFEQQQEPLRREARERIQPVAHKDCSFFLRCIFSKREKRNVQYASLNLTGPRAKRQAAIDPLDDGAGISGASKRETISWADTAYKPGSIVVKTRERALYYVLPEGEAIRYSVGVGRDGFQWGGRSTIAMKREWPSWTPPKIMIEREAAKGKVIPPFMEGGPENPLGARALYISGTMFRVHGTNNEASIGGAVSSGCIRMMNADVIDLYDRVRVGSPIIVQQ